MKAAAALVTALALAGCLGQPAAQPPAAAAAATTLDERAALRAEQLYQAAATTILAADRMGLVPAALRPRLAELDRRAYAAVRATRAAYRAGNAPGYAAAVAEADGAVRELLAAFRS